MKHINSLLLVVIMSVIGLSSCKKYDDGPFLTFKSADSRIEGEWILKTVDGEVFTMGTTEYTYVYNFKDNGHVTSTLTVVGETEPKYILGGEWGWLSNKDAINISISQLGVNDDCIITKLTSKDFVFEVEGTDDAGAKKMFVYILEKK